MVDSDKLTSTKPEARFAIYGSMNPKSPSKAHVYDNEIDGTLCGVSGYWMEAGQWFKTNGTEVWGEEGYLETLKFDDYIDCKKCNRIFRKNNYDKQG